MSTCLMSTVNMSCHFTHQASVLTTSHYIIRQVLCDNGFRVCVLWLHLPDRLVNLIPNIASYRVCSNKEVYGYLVERTQTQLVDATGMFLHSKL